ncbi:uncharacterized protein METZ01_LOCUS392419, partial [marine metagenome]
MDCYWLVPLDRSASEPLQSEWPFNVITPPLAIDCASINVRPTEKEIRCENNDRSTRLVPALNIHLSTGYRRSMY